MGSVIVSLPAIYDQTSALGTKKPQVTYIQFVPGVVDSVVTGADSEQCEGNYGRIGSIRALPHIGGKGIKKKSMIGEEHRYYPLLRGIQETPVIGDPVLLCTFGGRQYYLGPLNTEGSPNLNQDYFENDEIQSAAETFLKDKQSTTPNFISKDFKRMQKPLNKILDNPLYEGDKFISNAIHGDLIFEGRHGNSIRVGSRNENPYIIISNGRAVRNIVETSTDSTILGIFHRGSIRQHFNRDPILKDEFGNPTSTEELYKFTLADDEAVKADPDKPGKKQHISKTFKSSMGRGLGPSDGNGLPEFSTSDDDLDINKTIYDYNKEQLFVSSGRITFNARSDSIFLASNKFIHIGAGDNITFSTSNTFLVNAAASMVVNSHGLFKVHAGGKVYIDGRQKIVLGNPSPGYNDIIHPAVIGDGLVSHLVMLIEEIKKMAYSVSEAIEGRKVTGGSMSLMKRHIDAFDDFLGVVGVEDEESESSYVHPKALKDLILSKKVFLKI